MLPTAKQLSVADGDGQQWLHAADYTVHIGGGSPGGSDVPAAAVAAVSLLRIRRSCSAAGGVSPALKEQVGLCMIALVG